MSTESTARTPLPYRFVRLWVSTIVMCSMTVTLGGAVPGVVSTRTDFWPHPRGRWAPPCTADLELADLTEDDQHLAERMGALRRLLRQFEKPTGRFGRFALWTMNIHHSKGTDWGLQQISIERDATILDVGCG